MSIHSLHQPFGAFYLRNCPKTQTLVLDPRATVTRKFLMHGLDQKNPRSLVLSSVPRDHGGWAEASELLGPLSFESAFLGLPVNPAEDRLCLLSLCFCSLALGP